MDLLKKEDFDLIVVDHQTENTAAAEIISRIRSIRRNQCTPVIVIASQSDKHHVLAPDHLPALTEIVTRPLSEKELSDKITFHLEAAGRYRPLLQYFKEILGLFQPRENMIIISDTQLRTVFANDQFLRHKGLAPEKFANVSLADLFFPDNPDLLRNAIAQLTPERPSTEFIHEVLEGQKSPYRIHLKIQLIADENKQPLGYQWIIYNLPDQIWSRNNGPAQTQFFSPQNLPVSQLNSLISHAVRNSLFSVYGLTKILSDTHLNENQKRIVNKIKEAADNLQEVISHLNVHSLGDLSNIHPEATSFNLSRELRFITRTFRAPALRENIRIHLEIDPLIPDNLIGDPLILGQIIFILLRNLHKNGLSKTITLKVDSENVYGNLIQLRFTFSEGTPRLKYPLGDQNSGSSHFEEEIILPEIQKDGLDLYMTRFICETLNGKLEKIMLGPRTVFRLILPFEIAGKKEELNYKNMNVLLVDDNILNLKVVESILHKQGFRCDTALNGFEACEKTSIKHYDIILMDIQMPEMDGLDTTKLIRIREKESGNGKKSLIVALTAYSSSEDARKCLEHGMDGYLTKPFRFQDLVPFLKKLQN